MARSGERRTFVRINLGFDLRDLRLQRLMAIGFFGMANEKRTRSDGSQHGYYDCE